MEARDGRQVVSKDSVVVVDLQVCELTTVRADELQGAGLLGHLETDLGLLRDEISKCRAVGEPARRIDLVDHLSNEAARCCLDTFATRVTNETVDAQF